MRGIAGLRVEDVGELETFLGLPLSALSSGKDLGTIITSHIDILEAMWITQALKERQFDAQLKLCKFKILEKLDISNFDLNKYNILIEQKKTCSIYEAGKTIRNKIFNGGSYAKKYIKGCCLKIY